MPGFSTGGRQLINDQRQTSAFAVSSSKVWAMWVGWVLVSLALLFSPAAVQQGGVGRILYQRVFKGVLRLRRRPAPENQFGANQFLQGIVELWLRYVRNRADQLVRERAPEGRANLRHLPC